MLRSGLNQVEYKAMNLPKGAWKRIWAGQPIIEMTTTSSGGCKERTRDGGSGAELGCARFIIILARIVAECLLTLFTRPPEIRAARLWVFVRPSPSLLCIL